MEDSRPPQKFKIGQKITVFSNEEIANMNFGYTDGGRRSKPDYICGGMKSTGIENCIVTQYEKFNTFHKCWEIRIKFNAVGRNTIEDYKMLEKEFKEYYSDFEEDLIASIDTDPKIKISYKNRSGKILTETIEAATYEQALTKIDSIEVYYYMVL